MKALEWGTGSSTQWTLMRVGHLTSIEHDAGWAPAVQAAIDNMYDEDFLGQVSAASLRHNVHSLQFHSNGTNWRPSMAPRILLRKSISMNT